MEPNGATAALSNSGVAVVLRREALDQDWALAYSLEPAAVTANGDCGKSVAISGDGARVLVGCTNMISGRGVAYARPHDVVANSTTTSPAK